MKSNLSLVLTIALMISGAIAEAQQPNKIPRLGYLAASTPSANSTRVDAFRQSLRELGYVEGKNIVIEFRFAEGKLDRVPALASELVRLKVDVIVTAGPTDIPAGQGSANTTPLVLTQDRQSICSRVVFRPAPPRGEHQRVC